MIADSETVTLTFAKRKALLFGALAVGIAALIAWVATAALDPSWTATALCAIALAIPGLRPA